MGRMLWLLGLTLILVTVGLWLADATEVITGATDDHWSHLTLRVGIISLGGALFLRLLAPVVKQIRKGRCAVCGHPTERGHTYCLDHLQETVNAARDQARNRSLSRPNTLP